MALGLLVRQITFEVGFRGAFFWLLFWASKKVTNEKRNYKDYY
jgi:hypothetical protein